MGINRCLGGIVLDTVAWTVLCGGEARWGCCVFRSWGEEPNDWLTFTVSARFQYVKNVAPQPLVLISIAYAVGARGN